MPTIKDSLYFTYNGVSCRNFGLICVSLDNGLYEEQFVASRNINETKIRGNDEPVFNSIEEDPLQFDLTLAFTTTFTDQTIDNVILWLFQDYYKELYFEDKPDKIYLCMPVGDPRIVHNGLKQGYITITMRCKGSRIVSPLITTQTYDLSNNTTSYNITLQNTGHEKVFPELSILKVTDGNITITKNGKIFEIRDLTNQEDIYINSQKEIIQTDLPGTYRYDKVVGDFYDLAMDVGTNVYSIQGKCKISFRYRLKYKF